MVTAKAKTATENKVARTAATELANGDPRPVGLYAKMAYVMGQVQHVPKNGENIHFHYKYVREVDLTEHLRPLMAELGLLCIPSQTDIVHYEGEGSKRVTSILHRFTWVDAETGQNHLQELWGAGQDGQDKGPYKALTGAVKYALMKTLLVPTGDDPEATDGAGDSTAKEAGKKQQREPQQPAVQREPAKTKEPDKKPAKKQPVEKTEPTDEEILLAEQIETARAVIAGYIETMDEDEELKLEEGEATNKEAAGLLVITDDVSDDTRYLKALTRAQAYLEGVLVKHGYTLESDEEE